MNCTSKQSMITKLTKIFVKDLKANNTINRSHAEIVAEARATATGMVEARMANMEEEFADEADARSALPDGVVQELNTANPKKGNAKVTITEVNNGKIYVKFPKGTKEYPYSPQEISLDQQDAATIIAKYEAIKGISDTIVSNGIPNAPLDTLDTATVSEDVKLLNEQYKENRTPENKEKLLNAEISHGYRNTKGEPLVNLVESSPHNQGGSIFDFEEYYVDSDGTMDKTSRVNKKLAEIDKANAGENFDQAHSDSLNDLFNKFTILVKGFNTIDVKLKKKVLGEAIEAAGHFDPATGEIEVRLDTAGPAADFRNSIHMSNQEVYLHELVHSVMDFIFDKENLNIVRDTDMVAMINALETLYGKALKESTWETLLPGKANGVQYTKAEIQRAKDVWEYVFNNPNVNGLHEFMAHILTNKMFREGMGTLGALGTIKTKEGASTIEKIQNWFHNLMEKALGYATHKRDNSITKEGTTLILAILRANNNALDKVSDIQALNVADKAAETTGKYIKIGNDKLEKFIAPITTLIDSVEEVSKLSPDGKNSPGDLKEFRALMRDVKKILGPAKDKAKSTGTVVSNLTAALKNIINIINAVGRFLLAAKKLYRMKQIAGKTKRGRQLAQQYAAIINTALSAIGLTKDSFIRHTTASFMNRPGIYNFLADSILKLTQTVDNVREKTYNHIINDTDEWYGDVHINNNRINAKNNEAHTSVILRTDIQSLGIDAKGLQELLSDPKKVDKKIEELSKGLSNDQMADVNSMVNYMTTGVGTITNASNIHRGFGGIETGSATEQQIDQLISYKALDITSDTDKETMRKFLNGEGYVDYSGTAWNRAKKSVGFTGSALSESEYKKSVLKGVDTFILAAHGLQEASKKEIGKESHNVVKGYVKDTYTSDNEIEYHPLKNRVQLEKDGYTFIDSVSNNPASAEEYGMFVALAPKIKRTNGALGLQDRKYRGFTLKDMIGQTAANDTKEWDISKQQKAFEILLVETLEKYKEDRASVNMQPIYNAKGDIVNFRTTMSIGVRTKYLGLEARGMENLARSYSTMGTAAATSKHNEEVIDLLHTDYVNNYNKTTENDYVEIKPKSMNADDFDIVSGVDGELDTEYERLWARLPKDTKKYASKIFGRKGIMIRKDLLTEAFGEDDFSITEVKALEKLSPKTKANIRRIENNWQDVMQIAKGNIVIKTPTVLRDNIYSNFKILVYLGMSPVKAAKLMLLASRELKKYESDQRELGKLQRQKLMGMNPSKVRMKELEASIEANTVTPLIRAGLYQSIVEDVSTASDNNKISQWFVDKTDKYIPNETVNTVVQHLFMTKKTKPYQIMLKATQVSDFYSRYAQYYFLINDKGYSPERAMRETIDSHINYEAPLHKYVRYGDSMGPFFFVHYFVKSQKVTNKLVKENPGRVGLDVAIQHFITGDTPDTLDAHFVDKGLSTYAIGKVPERGLEAIIPPGGEIVHKLVNYFLPK